MRNFNEGDLHSNGGGYYALNRSYEVMLLCISLQYSAWAIPDTVTIVRLTDFLYPVSVTKRSALWCKLSASSLVTIYSLCENFIAHIFTMLSALSMSMSICAPYLPSTLAPTRHANTLVTTPLDATSPSFHHTTLVEHIGYSRVMRNGTLYFDEILPSQSCYSLFVKELHFYSKKILAIPCIYSLAHTVFMQCKFKNKCLTI